MANFPTSVYAPAAKAAGQTIQSAHVNSLDDEVAAIEDGYLNATARLNSSNSTHANLSVTGGSTFAGAVTLGGGQIVFPSTQVPSASTSALDDYKEGVWIPADGSTAGLVFAASTGHYVKVGKLVCFRLSVTYPVTADTAQVKLTTLPFASVYIAGCAVHYTDSSLVIALNVNAGDVVLTVNQMAGGAALTNAMLSGKFVYATGVYISS